MDGAHFWQGHRRACNKAFHAPAAAAWDVIAQQALRQSPEQPRHGNLTDGRFVPGDVSLGFRGRIHAFATSAASPVVTVGQAPACALRIHDCMCA